MPALSEYTNVYNASLEVLRDKGFQLWYDAETDNYCAEKDGWDFVADSPCSLLGLVAIYEHRTPAHYSEYWWRREGPDLYANLPKQAGAYVPVWQAKR